MKAGAPRNPSVCKSRPPCFSNIPPVVWPWASWSLLCPEADNRGQGGVAPLDSFPPLPRVMVQLEYKQKNWGTPHWWSPKPALCAPPPPRSFGPWIEMSVRGFSGWCSLPSTVRCVTGPLVFSGSCVDLKGPQCHQIIQLSFCRIPHQMVFIIYLLVSRFSEGVGQAPGP